MIYGEALGNSREAVRIYENRFPRRIVPDARTFTAIHRRLRETGSMRITRPNAGRERRNPEEEERILGYFTEHSTASCRSAAAVLGIDSHLRVWNVLDRNELHPFRYQRVQGLIPTDYPPRVQFSTFFLNQLRHTRNFSSRILFTDEAQFTRDGMFNHHNLHSWADENPHVIRQHGYQHRFSINVWAGIVADQLIGPIFFPVDSPVLFIQLSCSKLYPNCWSMFNLTFGVDYGFSMMALQLISQEMRDKYWTLIILTDGLDVVDQFHGLPGHLT